MRKIEKLDLNKFYDKNNYLLYEDEVYNFGISAETIITPDALIEDYCYDNNDNIGFGDHNTNIGRLLNDYYQLEKEKNIYDYNKKIKELIPNFKDRFVIIKYSSIYDKNDGLITRSAIFDIPRGITQFQMNKIFEISEIIKNINYDITVEYKINTIDPVTNEEHNELGIHYLYCGDISEKMEKLAQIIIDENLLIDDYKIEINNDKKVRTKLYKKY